MGLQASITWKDVNHDRKNKIYYTGNESPKSEPILKTNRFTSSFGLSPLKKVVLYEWDYPENQRR